MQSNDVSHMISKCKKHHPNLPICTCVMKVGVVHGASRSGIPIYISPESALHLGKFEADVIRMNILTKFTRRHFAVILLLHKFQKR